MIAQDTLFLSCLPLAPPRHLPLPLTTAHVKDSIIAADCVHSRFQQVSGCSERPIPRSKGNKLQACLVVHIILKQESMLQINKSTRLKNVGYHAIMLELIVVTMYLKPFKTTLKHFGFLYTITLLPGLLTCCSVIANLARKFLPNTLLRLA